MVPFKDPFDLPNLSKLNDASSPFPLSQGPWVYPDPGGEFPLGEPL